MIKIRVLNWQITRMETEPIPLENGWMAEWEEFEDNPLGQGGQGVVTKVRHRTKQTIAVCKRLLPRWRGDQQAHDRLRHEAEVLKKLHNVGARVPKVLADSMNFTTNDPFIIMEFIDGVRFDHWIKDKQYTTLTEALAIVKSVISTIELCHQHSIGHRDIKPTNIIIKDCDPDCVYIIDFGISFDSMQTIVLTRDGEMFRNEFIMLPECQDLEGGHRDLRSDITAIAGILFYCLTGQPPIMLRDSRGMPPHRREVGQFDRSVSNPRQREALNWLFDRAFKYETTNRFQTISDFITELERVAKIQDGAGYDLNHEVELLDARLKSENRKVQLEKIRNVYSSQWQLILDKAQARFKKLAGGTQVAQGNYRFDRIPVDSRPETVAEFIELPHCHAFHISKQHLDSCAVAVVVPMVEVMDVHVYIVGFTAPTNNLERPNKKPMWRKVAVIAEGVSLSNELTNEIVNGLCEVLAEQVSTLWKQ